jgi:peptidoglycan/LPS O-acetylase OafA/YrhL
MKKNKQIVGLDGLRFLAAMMVLLFHLGFWNWTKAESFHGPFPDAYAGFIAFAWFGWVGVEVFFVLSGFVIAYSAQRAAALTFLQHRLTRLVPAALLCSSLTAIVFLVLGKPLTTPSYIIMLWMKSITFFPVGPWIDNAYWTLEVEIAFYAVILALLIFKRFHRMPAVMAFIGGLSSAFWVAAFLPAHWPIARILHPAIVALQSHVTLNMLLLRHGCYFAIGAYLWLCFYSPIEGRRWTLPRIVVIAFSAMGGVLQIVFRSGDLDRISGYSFSPVLPVAVWLGTLIFMSAAVAKNDAIHSVLGPLGASVLRKLGLMTYPLYLMHQAIGIELIRLFSRGLTAMQSWALAVAIVLGVAYVVSAYAEPFLQRLLRRWLDARSQDRVREKVSVG